MDSTKRGAILDGAADFYIAIRDVLGLPKGDSRSVVLHRATERYIAEVMALVEALDAANQPAARAPLDRRERASR